MTTNQKYLVFLICVIGLSALLYIGFLDKYGASNQATPAKSTTEKKVAVEAMTDEEKNQAIQEELQKNPPVEMTGEEKTAVKKQIDEMLNSSNTSSAYLTGNFKPRVHFAGGGVKLVTVYQPYIVRDDIEIEPVGKKYLILDDDFKIDAGPDLHVFLSGTANPQNSADLHKVGDVDLGKLKNTSGAQMYEMPDTVDFAIKSVVIYCVPFKVVFAYADIK